MNVEGIVATGAGTARTFGGGIKRHVAMQAVGHDNTGTYNGATVHLEITVNGIDYVSVGNKVLAGTDGATDIIEWTGVALGYRYNVTAYTAPTGDADMDIAIIDERV